jgi:hypothetical protein
MVGVNMNDIVILYNKETKQVKRVPRSELSKYNLPQNYVSDVDNLIASVKSGQTRLSSVDKDLLSTVQKELGPDFIEPAIQAGTRIATGSGQLTDYSVEDKAKINDLIIKSGQTLPAAKSADKRVEEAGKAASQLMDTLEQRYMEAKGGEYSGAGAWLSGIKKDTQGSFNLDTAARVYNKERKGFLAALKAITLDTGVLSDPDAERLAGLLPTFQEDPSAASAFFQDVRNQMSAKFGFQSKPTTYVPPESKGGFLPALADVLVPETKKLVEEYPQRIAQNQTPAQLGMAKITGDTVGERFKQLPDAMLTAGKETSKQFLGPAFEIASWLTSLGKGKQMVNSVTGGGINPLKKLAEKEMKQAAANTLPISTDPIKAAAAKYSTIDPTSTNLAKNALSTLPKSMSQADLVERLGVWNKAFNSAGQVGKSAKAGLYQTLFRAGQELLDPNVAKTRQAMKNIYTVKGIAEKYAVPAAIGGVSSAGVFGLFDWLKSKK